MLGFTLTNKATILVAFDNHHHWEYRRGVSDAPVLSEASQSTLKDDNTSYFMLSVPQVLAQNLLKNTVGQDASDDELAGTVAAELDPALSNLHSRLQVRRSGYVHFCFSQPALHHPDLTNISLEERNELIFNLMRTLKDERFLGAAKAYDPKQTFYKGILAYCRDNNITLPNDLVALDLYKVYGVDLVRPVVPTMVSRLPPAAKEGQNNDDDDSDSADTSAAESATTQSSSSGAWGYVFRLVLFITFIVLALWAGAAVSQHDFSLMIGDGITAGIANLFVDAVQAVSFPPEAYLGMAIVFVGLAAVTLIETCAHCFKNRSALLDDDGSESNEQFVGVSAAPGQQTNDGTNDNAVGQYSNPATGQPRVPPGSGNNNVTTSNNTNQGGTTYTWL